MEKEFIKKQITYFNLLCDRAKELILENMIGTPFGKTRFFDVEELDEHLIKLSPIEQILDVAFRVYDIETEQKYPFPTIIERQKGIQYLNKIYIADFYIEEIFEKQTKRTKTLKKPIIIECDGYNYHSSKKQMNNDYERENNLKISGYNVIRFTGSQIYKEPFKCVQIIYKEIQNAISNKEYLED